MKKRLTYLAALIIFFAFLSGLWWNQAIKPFNLKDTGSVQFIIPKGEGSRSIAERLSKDKIIRSPVAFFLLARFGGLANQIQAGTFELSPSMDMFEVADMLKTGKQDIKITIIEGWRKEEIAVKLSSELNFPESEILKYVKEGYLFPDTYNIPKNASVSAVMDIFNANFNKKVNDQIRSSAKNMNLTLDELITIASMVEREAKLEQDRSLIASVILNRLNDNMKLDIDATVQYALGYQPAAKTWWKKELTLDDLSVDSSYNTYLFPGLPPGPICNPGLSVIEAVVNAPKTDFYYYIGDKTGKSHFAKDFEEHSANIEKYLN